ncbi:MAG: hypothetical protein ABI180_04735 [Microcoleus sp.]
MQPAASIELADRNVLGFVLSRKSQIESSIAPSTAEKSKKRSIALAGVNPTGDRANLRGSAFSGSPQLSPHSHQLSAPRQNPNDAQLLKISNSSEVRKLRCPASNNRTRSSPNL